MLQEELSLTELCVKRSSVKGQVTKFRNYIDKLSQLEALSVRDRAELTLRLSKFEALSSRFDELQSLIEISNPDKLETELEERENIEAEFISSIVAAQTLLQIQSKDDNAHDSSNMHNCGQCIHYHNETGIRLPLISIPKFDGSHLKWMEFRDTFKSLVHENSRISPVNKFHYLLSYLEGEPARTVSNLEISSNNYQEAWNLLLERYDNKRLLIKHHIRSLLNVEPMQRESEKSLRFLVDHVTKNLRALAQLGRATEHWDDMVVELVSSKLDNATFVKWEERCNTLSTESPTLKDLKTFLNDRAAILESVHRSKADGVSKSNQGQQRSGAPVNAKSERSHTRAHTCTNTNTNNGDQQKSASSSACSSCKSAEHKIFDCPSFKAMSVNDRIAEASKLRLCRNCLRSGHFARQCRFGPCRECKRRHNSLLHLAASTEVNVASVTGDARPGDTIVNFSNEQVSQSLLSTALIEVVNPKTSKTETVRALLDCGSQSSFITSNLKQRLSLEGCPLISTNVMGFGNSHAGTITAYCIAKLKSRNTSFNVISSFYVMDQLTNSLPNAYFDISSFKFPRNVVLADPKFYEPSQVDILIGSDLFWDIIGCEQQSLGPRYPRLHSSKLGWLIGGPLPCSNKQIQNVKCNHAVTSSMQDDDSMQESTMSRFWELEEVPSKKYLSTSERACESHFVQHTRRLQDGRFCVRLPLAKPVDCLGDSYTMARKRFSSLEKRFRRQPEVKSQYVEFIREYAELGHLSEIALDDDASNLCFYLPHHPVFKESSETTKIRVVFDASARTSSGVSVNDLQMIGPQVQDSLFSILIRARLYKYILTADIEKMYRQVLVNEYDRNLQLIVWREDESQPLKILRLNTITYGFASASFLSTRCLWQLGEECDESLTKTILQHDLYVDDLITGCDSEEELKRIQVSVSDALMAGCFKLRKYKSNSSHVLESCASKSTDKLVLSESASALGLGWDSKLDCLYYCFDMPPSTDKLTKRYILSTSFKIFDPLGFVSPCIIIPKLIMQQLWLDRVGWDDDISSEMKQAWMKFYNCLNNLSVITVPRRVLCDSPVVTELHSFSDASQKAYGACIYMRSIDSADHVHVSLLCSKSKVAPVKACTIPRLELCAALLAARLCQAVVDSLRYPVGRRFHWCDSSVVLAWLRAGSNKLKTFVANRVAEILEVTKLESWRYVPTSDNPADLVSRGVYPDELRDNSLWWSGPNFLLLNESSWPTLSSGIQEQCDVLELRSNVANVDQDNSSIIPFTNFSKLNKLKRVYAYVLRFMHNLKNPKNKRLGRDLTVPELQETFHLLCRVAQWKSFPLEYKLLASNKSLNSKSSIIALSPFMDDKDLIRVGGRLDASSLPYDSKHPILLHSSHHFTKLIFEREHLHKLHAGPQLLLASVRTYVWPINGRHLARRTVHNCIQCRKVQGKTLSPLMGKLPSQRVTVDFPFRSVGVDFAGPFFVLNKRGRGARLTKCYLCIFICLRFKCVHLEAVSDLSSSAFILTLRRFIARRGKPVEVFCDNGRNFVAAAKEIGNFLKDNKKAINLFFTEEEIKFSFSPPYAPHFGGIWEAGVKSAKFHVKRVMGNTHLTFEEISTLFAQVEAILNSRPICPLSSSPSDCLFLTPGHFLLGRPLTALPSPDLVDSKATRLQRYERLEQIRQHFWKRWQREYLAELQQRSKWRTPDTPLALGDLVLLQEENLPPLCWRLGRISKLFPGPDGTCTVAEVQTNRGSF